MSQPNMDVVNRLARVMWDAIEKECTLEDGKIYLPMTEIVEACLQIQGMSIAGGIAWKQNWPPATIRRYVEGMAKRLRSLIADGMTKVAEGQMGATVIPPKGKGH